MKDAIKSFYLKLKKISNFQELDKSEDLLKDLFPKLNYINDEKKKILEDKLNIKISRTEFYEQALTHRSFCQVEKEYSSNERLEFLGDSALGMVVAEYLFYRHKDLPEGELTKIRSWLVNKHTLAICAKELGLVEHLRLSYSAATSIDKGGEAIIADALEAIIAAIYLDKGYMAAKEFILRSLLPIMLEHNLLKDDNFKSILLEKAQADGFEYPKYSVLSEEGPDHEKTFKVLVKIDSLVIGEGEGKSKKQAEQNAAKNALENYDLSNIKLRLNLDGKADN